MRRALGFPDELYRRLFEDPKAGVSNDPYKTSTSLFVDMAMCKELGFSLQYWATLTATEKKMWRYWFVLDGEKTAVQRQRAEDEAKAKSAPKAATRTAVRR